MVAPLVQVISWSFLIPCPDCCCFNVPQTWHHCLVCTYLRQLVRIWEKKVIYIATFQSKIKLFSCIHKNIGSNKYHSFLTQGVWLNAYISQRLNDDGSIFSNNWIMGIMKFLSEPTHTQIFIRLWSQRITTWCPCKKKNHHCGAFTIRYWNFGEGELGSIIHPSSPWAHCVYAWIMSSRF